MGYRLGRAHDDLPARAASWSCAATPAPSSSSTRSASRSVPARCCARRSGSNSCLSRPRCFVGLDEFHSADIATRDELVDRISGERSSRTASRRHTSCRTSSRGSIPMSAEYLWARETYRMGLRCIAFTPWLAEMLRRRMRRGRRPSSRTAPTSRRTRSRRFDEREPGLVVVYARRETPRRGVELALAGLAALVERRPDTRVVLFGSGAPATVPFPCEDIGVLPPADWLASIVGRTSESPCR